MNLQLLLDNNDNNNNNAIGMMTQKISYHCSSQLRHEDSNNIRRKKRFINHRQHNQLFSFICCVFLLVFVDDTKRDNNSYTTTHAFLFVIPHSTKTTINTKLDLIPVRNMEYSHEINYLSSQIQQEQNEQQELKNGMDNSAHTEILYEYELCYIEEDDLIELSRFIVQSFGADMISMSTVSDFNQLEKQVMKPALELVNGYSSIVAFAEVLAGTRSRIRYRQQQQQQQSSSSLDTNNMYLSLSAPNVVGLSSDEQMKMASGTSIILVVVEIPKQKRKKILNNEQQSWDRNLQKKLDMKIIASIELRLQPSDAKIPFSLPFLDRIERKLVSILRIGKEKEASTTKPKNNNNNKKNHSDLLQPYLSNLCVDSSYRQKGWGRILVNCVEDIAFTIWDYPNMYLHVDIENIPALTLYEKLQYRDVGRRWQPFWAGQAAEIGYYVKKREGKK